MYPNFEPTVDAELTNLLIAHVAATDANTGSACRINATDEMSTYIVVVAYETTFTIERVLFNHTNESFTTVEVIKHDVR